MSSLCSSLLVAMALLTASTTLPSAHAQLNAPPHDLKMIADQPVIALWARPDVHLKNPALAELFKAMIKTGPEEAQASFGTTIPKMDLLKVSMNPGKRAWGDEETPIPVVVMHLTDPAAATALFTGMKKSYKPKTVPGLNVPIYQYESTPYTKADGTVEEDKWMLRNGVAQLDPQTIINGQSVEKLIQVATAKSPVSAGAWGSDFAAVASSPSLMLFDVAKLRTQLESDFKRRPPPTKGLEAMIFNAVKPLWEESDYAFLAADTTDGIKLTGLAKSASPDAAKRFKGTLEGIVAMGKGFLPSLKPMLEQFNAKTPGLGEKIYSDLETAVNSVSITQDGTTTKLALHIKQDCLNQVVSGVYIPLLEQEYKEREERRERYKAEAKSLEKSETKQAIPELPAK
jgi:hypothetical protein